MSVNYSGRVELVECPRDAMQGWPAFIPTKRKIEYLNALLKVGFHTLDCGSFVSPKAVPQMADTKEVVSKLDLARTKTRLLVIVANVRGAQEAIQLDTISYLGYPFSISPTFQIRNTNSTMEDSIKTVDQLQGLCLQNNKELVVYLSMAFGNPYGDPYEEEVLLDWADELVKRDIKIISLADTIGVATPDQINFALGTLIPTYPQAKFGVHLHSNSTDWEEKLAVAVDAGCRRFDGSLKGIGGCPMAANVLTGNMKTEWMIGYFEKKGLLGSIDKAALAEALTFAEDVFV